MICQHGHVPHFFQHDIKIPSNHRVCCLKPIKEPIVSWLNQLNPMKPSKVKSSIVCSWGFPGPYTKYVLSTIGGRWDSEADGGKAETWITTGSDWLWQIMWGKQCHKPSMTGNGGNTTYKNGDLRGLFIIVLTTLHANTTVYLGLWCHFLSCCSWWSDASSSFYHVHLGWLHWTWHVWSYCMGVSSSP